MQPYDHKETKGSLWPNDKAKEEPEKGHPSMKGSFKWQGELVEIAASLSVKYSFPLK